LISVSRPRVHVRQTRQGRELRIDGTFASWDPGEPPFGSVWGALALPVLALKQRPRPAVLVLGLGGGSAARVLKALAPEATMVGVERDRDVVETARRDFGLDGLGMEVVLDDAQHYLERGRRRFDLIVEDIFVGSARTVRKPDWLIQEGLALATEQLARSGILVCNTIDETRRVTRTLQALFPSVVALRHEEYVNTILAASREPLSGRQLRALAGRHPALKAHLRAFSFGTVVPCR